LPLPNSFEEIKFFIIGIENYYVKWLLDPKHKQEVSKIEITNYPTSMLESSQVVREIIHLRP
jgi:hypothetical protein